ncbi:MAG: SCO family protein [Steroidobacteraceae bacterium]
MSKRMSVGAPLLAASLVLALPCLAWSQTEAVDPHAQHQAPAGGTRVSTADYVIPQVSLVRDDGKKVFLAAELDDARPVVLNFIYTTCPGICPLMSQVFSQFQRRLGAERGKVHMVSISIDPEQDTPARLRAYAKKFRAGSQWQHYTGTVEASVQVQKAFDAYRGDKMSHDPLTLMRAAPGSPWVRMDGFASASDLFDQYRNLAGVGSTKVAVN